MSKNSTFVGLDVHKDSIVIALADSGRNGDVRLYGTIPGDINSLLKVVRKLESKGHTLHFAYEAGPCGYKIYRSLTNKGYDCIVVAPSKIPQKSGDRVKTDRRDALNLARLHRSGDLTPVYVPTPEDEAMRDLIRSREDAIKILRLSKQTLNAMLLRHGFRYNGKSYWSRAHMNWIADIKMPHHAQQLALQEYIHQLKEQIERVKRITEQVEQLVEQWKLEPVVKALMGMRGVSLIVGATTVAEIGDLSRFKSPKQLMAYLGLVPSEYSTGPHIRRGSITKTGNGHLRKVLAEAAHAYRYPARVSKILLKRHEGLSEEVKKIAWKAQVRLCSKYRKLSAKGKHYNVAIIAIARELCGFMWAIAKVV